VGSEEVIEIPAEPADRRSCRRSSKASGCTAVGDRYQLVARRPLSICLLLGTGEFSSRLLRSASPQTDRLCIWGLCAKRRTRRIPKRAEWWPADVEVSRDGRRVYFTNSLYAPWDAQFYPEGIRSWMGSWMPNQRGLALDPKFFLEFERCEATGSPGRGDASSDSYCYP